MLRTQRILIVLSLVWFSLTPACRAANGSKGVVPASNMPSCGSDPSDACCGKDSICCFSPIRAGAVAYLKIGFPIQALAVLSPGIPGRPAGEPALVPLPKADSNPKVFFLSCVTFSRPPPIQAAAAVGSA